MTKKKTPQPEQPAPVAPTAPPMDDTDIIRKAQRLATVDAYKRAAQAARRLADVLDARAGLCRTGDHAFGLTLAHQQVRAMDDLNRAQGTAQQLHGDELLHAPLHLAIAG